MRVPALVPGRVLNCPAYPLDRGIIDWIPAGQKRIDLAILVRTCQLVQDKGSGSCPRLFAGRELS